MTDEELHEMIEEGYKDGEGHAENIRKDIEDE